MGDISKKVDDLPDKFWDRFLATYKLMKGSGEASDSEKEVLLEKLRTREISREECLRLNGMLEKGASESLGKGAFGLFIVILGTLALIAMVLSAKEG